MTALNNRPARPTKADATLTDLAAMMAAHSQITSARLWITHYDYGVCADLTMAAKFRAQEDAARDRYFAASSRIAERNGGTYGFMTVSERREAILAASDFPSKANDYGRAV